jgi:hypothetical protein
MNFKETLQEALILSRDFGYVLLAIGGITLYTRIACWIVKFIWNLI